MNQRLNATREDWLNSAITALRPLFSSLAGREIPEKVRASCGFTSKGARSTRIGECWSKSSSKDGTFEMFISPMMDDTARVLDILVHELVHAAVGLEEKHGRVFRKCAESMHLTGKMTATVPGPGFAENVLQPVMQAMGGAQYPHASLTAGKSTTGPKQSTRMLKCVCKADDCGYTVRTTAKWLETRGAPICPCNREPMEVSA